MEYNTYYEPATFEQAMEDRANWKRRCTELAAELAQAQARVSELAAQRPATLRQALEALLYACDSPQLIKMARAALAPAEAVSTLCAVCDQIKELHPNTHPWTAKASVSETTGEPPLKPPLPGHGQYCICDKCMAYYAPKTK